MPQAEDGILLGELTTAHLADACLRLGVPVRCAPHAMRPAAPGMRASGRARPVRHVGSVDVFLEAIEEAETGDILVVDNDGRLDEACVGDLITLEAKSAGLAGIVIWGLHRDSREISEIGLPLFSLGVISTGPQRLDQRPADVFDAARVGSHLVTSSDLVIADADGVLFLPRERLLEIVASAATIRETERRQARGMAGGR
ncbi:MAG TPA: RraA family protein, partial [bacterium]|nr:RraA family protein [bacterium]